MLRQTCADEAMLWMSQHKNITKCGNTMVICHENGFPGCHLESNLLFPIMLLRTSVFHPVQYSCDVNPDQRSSVASLRTISDHGQWEFALKQEGAWKHAYSREKINVGRAGGHFCRKSPGATEDQKDQCLTVHKLNNTERGTDTNKSQLKLMTESS